MIYKLIAQNVFRTLLTSLFIQIILIKIYNGFPLNYNINYIHNKIQTKCTDFF